ncbi:MAG: sulfotransferase domain-containing protein [Desulfuromonadaceae bacterium]
MAKIHWLASYPKSGNTWMRILLTNYLRNGSEPADINRIDGGPIASARFWFDEWVGVEASALDDSTIERLRPGVYRCMAGEEQNTLYMKVHDAWIRTDQGEALFPAEVTAGVVYILRNPLDMAASCAHHWGVSMAQAVEDLCDSTYASSRSLGGMADQLRRFMGSWSSHVRSWLDESGLPVCLVRYEDLKRDPERYFGEVVSFCGLTLDTERVHKAVSFSSFGELQRQEKEKGFQERSFKAPGDFFRRGEVGSWRDELAPDLAQQLIDTHGETMRRFGYLDEKGQPV